MEKSRNILWASLVYNLLVALLQAIRVAAIKGGWNLVARSTGLPQIGWGGAFGVFILLNQISATSKLYVALANLKKNVYKAFDVEVPTS